jgi:hypothetical protein
VPAESARSGVYLSHSIPPRCKSRSESIGIEGIVFIILFFILIE